MKEHTTHHDGCACYRDRVIDEVLDVLRKAQTMMKEEGKIVTIGGLIEAVEEMKR